MRITVQYHAQARATGGAADEVTKVDAPCSMHQLLPQIAQWHPELRPMVLSADGRPHPSLLTFVGDRMVRIDSSECFRDGDVVSMHAPVFGG